MVELNSVYNNFIKTKSTDFKSHEKQIGERLVGFYQIRRQDFKWALKDWYKSFEERVGREKTCSKRANKELTKTLARLTTGLSDVQGK